MVFCIQLLGWIVIVALSLRFVYNICHFCYTVYFAAAFGRNLDPRKYGPWAVVTGSTDGIGKAFAQKFASLGINVVLISRNAAKLKQVAEEIKRDNLTVQIKTIAADFTEGQSIYAKIKTELAPLSIGILVNNVGMAKDPGLYTEVFSEDEVRQIINCNVMSLVRLSNMVLPSMRKKKRGLIINIGSLLGTGTTPLFTIYGATKAFLDKFSQDLASEYSQDGIHVQSVMTGGVATKMASMKGKPTLSIPDPEVFVEANMRTLGIESRSSCYWVHKIFLYICETLNFFAPGLTQKLAFKLFNAIRESMAKIKLAAATQQS